MSNPLTPLDQLVREQIASRGPIDYVELVELALYHRDHGFYSSGGHAGRRGDFITSPEVGPLFGHLVAKALDAEWERLAQPEVFSVVDYGAGPGTLARAIHAAAPRCSDALQYLAIERSVEQRSMHPEWVLSLPELSSDVVGEGLTGVVLANELLDNLAFTPVERSAGILHRTVVDVSGGALVAVPGEPLSEFEAALFGPSIGSAVLQTEAAGWLAAMHETLQSGRIVVIDYARRASEEVQARTYAEHGHAGSPLVGLGSKDITVDLDLEQLQSAVNAAISITTQAQWLTSLGIDELVEEGRALWEAGAATGSLAALKGRSRIREAEALVDSDGLGGFLVAEWVVG